MSLNARENNSQRYDGWLKSFFVIKFPVRSEKIQELYERMQRLSILEEDIDESFIRCSGRGGQKVNKTSSGVRLYHRPTGLEVKCTKERSQSLNRFFARRMLIEKLEAGIAGDASPVEIKAARIRKQKQKRRARRRKADGA